jgi:hypothetical protein
MPGMTVDKLRGGVFGGSLLQGKFNVGDEIEIRPGTKIEQGGKVSYEPICTFISSLMSGSTVVSEVCPGGLVGLGTMLDPTLTKADSLVGSVVGKPGSLPPTRVELKLKVTLLDRVVGTKEMQKVEHLKARGEPDAGRRVVGDRGGSHCCLQGRCAAAPQAPRVRRGRCARGDQQDAGGKVAADRLWLRPVVPRGRCSRSFSIPTS